MAGRKVDFRKGKLRIRRLCCTELTLLKRTSNMAMRTLLRMGYCRVGSPRWSTRSTDSMQQLRIPVRARQETASVVREPFLSRATMLRGPSISTAAVMINPARLDQGIFCPKLFYCSTTCRRPSVFWRHFCIYERGVLCCYCA